MVANKAMSQCQYQQAKYRVKHTANTDFAQVQQCFQIGVDRTYLWLHVQGKTLSASHMMHALR